LEKKGIGKSSDIHEKRTLSQFFKHTPIGKTGCRYPKQSKRVGRGEPVPERDGQNKDDAITMLSNQLLTITETKGIENKNY
jgi:hypothetical protein